MSTADVPYAKSLTDELTNLLRHNIPQDSVIPFDLTEFDATVKRKVFNPLLDIPQSIAFDTGEGKVKTVLRIGIISTASHVPDMFLAEADKVLTSDLILDLVALKFGCEDFQSLAEYIGWMTEVVKASKIFAALIVAFQGLLEYSSKVIRKYYHHLSSTRQYTGPNQRRIFREDKDYLAEETAAILELFEAFAAEAKAYPLLAPRLVAAIIGNEAALNRKETRTGWVGREVWTAVLGSFLLRHFKPMFGERDLETVLHLLGKDAVVQIFFQELPFAEGTITPDWSADDGERSEEEQEFEWCALGRLASEDGIELLGEVLFEGYWKEAIIATLQHITGCAAESINFPERGL